MVFQGNLVLNPIWCPIRRCQSKRYLLYSLIPWMERGGQISHRACSAAGFGLVRSTGSGISSIPRFNVGHAAMWHGGTTMQRDIFYEP